MFIPFLKSGEHVFVTDSDTETKITPGLVVNYVGVKTWQFYEVENGSEITTDIGNVHSVFLCFCAFYRTSLSLLSFVELWKILTLRPEVYRVYTYIKAYNKKEYLDFLN